MGALSMDSKKLIDSNREIKVSEFCQNDFSIGKYKFRWETASCEGDTMPKLHVESREIFGPGVNFLVKNKTQLIFKLASGDNTCTVCFGEDGYEVELNITWLLLQTEGPQLIEKENESNE